MQARSNSKTQFPLIRRLRIRLGNRSAHSHGPGSAALFFSLALSLVATNAQAVDGVLEINHVCAEQTGCFAGDAPGYPVTIDGLNGRSFRLTSRLVVPDVDTDGIVISDTSDSITIDLNGFEITRVGCAGTQATCVAVSGTGNGIVVVGAGGGVTAQSTTVTNGRITGMGFLGIWLKNDCSVSDMVVRWNRSTGVACAGRARVTRNTISSNGSTGIAASGVIDGNTVSFNGNHGIDTGSESIVIRNAVRNNAGDGITVGEASSVLDNVAVDNGDAGIYAAAGSLVSRNVVRDNDGIGVSLSPTSIYRENVISGNGGSEVNSGVNMGHNSCDGAFTCP